MQKKSLKDIIIEFGYLETAVAYAYKYLCEYGNKRRNLDTNLLCLDAAIKYFDYLVYGNDENQAKMDNFGNMRAMLNLGVNYFVLSKPNGQLVLMPKNQIVANSHKNSTLLIYLNNTLNLNYVKLTNSPKSEEALSILGISDNEELNRKNNKNILTVEEKMSIMHQITEELSSNEKKIKRITEQIRNNENALNGKMEETKFLQNSLCTIIKSIKPSTSQVVKKVDTQMIK